MWIAGDRAYLSWLQLSENSKRELSQYRTTAGTVECWRRGTGIRKTVGVRFNSDPELTWLAPSELSRVPEID